MNINPIIQILERHKIPTTLILKDIKEEDSIALAYHLWQAIQESKDPLSPSEHAALLEFCWSMREKIHKKKIQMSEKLKTTLISSRARLPRYDLVLAGEIEGGLISSLVSVCRLGEREESELWNVFHVLYPKSSSRSAEQIDATLGTFSIIEQKVRLFKKINVLDIGCGMNGNGISTLCSKFPGKIAGFGIDLDVQEHPSNVHLVKGSAERIPFKENFFDVVYACNVIYYFDDKRIGDVITEILRVMRNGAILVFDDNKRSLAKFQKILSDSRATATIVAKNPFVFVKNS